MLAPAVLLLAAAASLTEAKITVDDPGDYADLGYDALDNTILADYTTDDGGDQYLIYNITGPYYYYDTDATVEHSILTVDENDTSVVVITEGSSVNLSYNKVIKYGYNTWLNQASFFGVNAAINVANDSTSYIEHSNITVHNGAANIFVYGTGSVVYVDDVDLYSSGPISHGVYAAGNGTAWVSNVRHYSGGNRASSFSGDSPGGYVHVTDAVAHTTGIGSAIFYTLGQTYGTNVIGHAENAPVVFSDGIQLTSLTNVDLTAGLLAGTILFTSTSRKDGASIAFNNSRLTVTAIDGAGLWFGNVIATAEIIESEIKTESGILVIANTSQVTQAFDYFAGPEQNDLIEPAVVTVTVSGSTLIGDIVAFNGSSISWNLTDYSNWKGKTAQGYTATNGTFEVILDSTSTWTLSSDVFVNAFVDSLTDLSNIASEGFNLYYQASNTTNDWLNNQTISLSGGGVALPYTS